MPDILLGVAYSLARNYLSNLVRGRALQPVISFQGGTAANLALKKAFSDLLHLNDGELIVPEHFNTMGAYGAALLAIEKGRFENIWTLAGIMEELGKRQGILYADHDDSFYPRLFSKADDSANSLMTSQQDNGRIIPGETGVFVGIDIGSVSEKIVAIDPQGEILYSNYCYSQGKVLEQLVELFREFNEKGFDESVLGMGVTGSGRYLGAKAWGRM